MKFFRYFKWILKTRKSGNKRAFMYLDKRFRWHPLMNAELKDSTFFKFWWQYK